MASFGSHRRRPFGLGFTAFSGKQVSPSWRHARRQVEAAMRWMRWLVAGALAVTGAVVVPPPERAEAAGVRPAIWVEPSGNSIFRDSVRSPESRDDIRLDTAKNDYEGAQIVLKSPAGFTVNAVEFTALSGATDSIPAA